jgi:hypothetical protein
MLGKDTVNDEELWQLERQGRFADIVPTTDAPAPTLTPSPAPAPAPARPPVMPDLGLPTRGPPVPAGVTPAPTATVPEGVPETDHAPGKK